MIATESSLISSTESDRLKQEWINRDSRLAYLGLSNIGRKHKEKLKLRRKTQRLNLVLNTSYRATRKKMIHYCCQMVGGNEAGGLFLMHVAMAFCRFAKNQESLNYFTKIGFCYGHSVQRFVKAFTGKKTERGRSFSVKKIRNGIKKAEEAGLVTHLKTPGGGKYNCNHYALNVDLFLDLLIGINQKLDPEFLSDDFGESSDRTEKPIKTTCDKKNNIKPFLKVKPKEKKIMEQKTSDRREIKTDRYFGQRSQITEIRERSRLQSVVGMSKFRDAEDVEQCRSQLIAYYSKIMSVEKASEKAHWEIHHETKGSRSPYIQDYFDSKEIGTCAMREWHVAPGVVAPMFLRFLKCELKRKDDTCLQAIQRVEWALQKTDTLSMMWSEFKRQAALQEPRYKNAIASGLGLGSIDFPEWLIESYQVDVPVEQAASAIKEIEAPIAESIDEDAIALARFEDHISRKKLIRDTTSVTAVRSLELSKATSTESVTRKPLMVFTDLFRSLNRKDKEDWIAVWKDLAFLGKDLTETDFEFLERRRDLRDTTNEPVFEITDAIATDVSRSLKDYFGSGDRD